MSTMLDQLGSDIWDWILPCIECQDIVALGQCNRYTLRFENNTADVGITHAELSYTPYSRACILLFRATLTGHYVHCLGTTVAGSTTGKRTSGHTQTTWTHDRCACKCRRRVLQHVHGTTPTAHSSGLSHAQIPLHPRVLQSKPLLLHLLHLRGPPLLVNSLPCASRGIFWLQHPCLHAGGCCLVVGVWGRCGVGVVGG